MIKTMIKKAQVNIKLVAPYQVDGFQVGSIDEVAAHLSSIDCFSVDCETRPKKEWELYEEAGLDPHTSDVVMLQVGDQETQWVIDTRYVKIDKIIPMLEDVNKIKCGVNLKFDTNNYWLTLALEWDHFTTVW